MSKRLGLVVTAAYVSEVTRRKEAFGVKGTFLFDDKHGGWQFIDENERSFGTVSYGEWQFLARGIQVTVLKLHSVSQSLEFDELAKRVTKLIKKRPARKRARG